MCKVRIRRQPQSYQSADVSEGALSDPRWDNVCGGLQIRVSTVSIYAYMDYHALKEIGIACSGEHDWGYNKAKVCMNKKDNTGKGNEKFEPAYCRFIVQADYNTRNGFIDYKRTRTVSEYLKNNPVSRKELMMQLESEETDVKALREAINILLKAGYLTVEGSQRGQNSILSLTEAFPY